MNCRKKHIRPNCAIVDIELTNVILADSQPQSSNRTEEHDSNSYTNSWENIWKEFG